MTRLRHLSDDNLKRLEAKIEALKVPVMMLGLNYVGSTWYAHFVVVEGRGDIDERPLELLEQDKILSIKKPKSRSK